MPSSPRSSNGRRPAVPKTRAPGSWPRRNIVRSTSGAETTSWSASSKISLTNSRGPAGGSRVGPRRRDRRRHRRRPLASRVHDVPPGPLDRGARGAHAPPPRRADDRGDRARVPGPGADRRPAHRPGQTDPRGEASRSRSPAVPSWPAPLVGPGSHLPHLQRGLLGDGAATTGCDRRSARTRSRSAESSPSSPPTSPRCTASSRSWRSRRRGSTLEPVPRASPSFSSIRTARAGISCSSVAVSRRSSVPARPGAIAPVPTRSRPRSPPVTRVRAPRRRRTGRASPSSTPSSPSSRHRRSSS